IIDRLERRIQRFVDCRRPLALTMNGFGIVRVVFRSDGSSYVAFMKFMVASRRREPVLRTGLPDLRSGRERQLGGSGDRESVKAAIRSNGAAASTPITEVNDNRVVGNARYYQNRRRDVEMADLQVDHIFADEPEPARRGRTDQRGIVP